MAVMYILANFLRFNCFLLLTSHFRARKEAIWQAKKRLSWIIVLML